MNDKQQKSTVDLTSVQGEQPTKAVKPRKLGSQRTRRVDGRGDPRGLIVARN
jgi:hypothetical protein